MATTPTSIGPIGARQINHSLYVGQSDLSNIQQAVTVAARIGGIFTVIIPFDYTGSDTISAVTGGNSGIEIIDQRNGQMQTYAWSGTQFYPLAFQQGSAFISTGTAQVSQALPLGSMAMYFNPTAGSIGGGAIVATAPAGHGMPFISISAQPSDGTAGFNFMQFGLSSVTGNPLTNINSDFIVNGVIALTPESRFGGATAIVEGFFLTRDLSNLNVETDFINSTPIGMAGGFNWYNVDVGTELDDTTPPIMWLDGSTDTLHVIGGISTPGSANIGSITIGATGSIAGISSLSATGQISTTGAVTGASGSFATLQSASSPVRTFANTPDVPEGMEWPPAGIGVSTGTAWAASINPATLATWPAAGIPVSTGTAWGASLSPGSLATYPAAGIAVSTGTAWGTPIAAATLATWPSAGVPVSTGTTWSPSINPADIPRLSATNTFTGVMLVKNNFAVLTDNGTVPVTTPAQGGLVIGWDTASGAGETDFINIKGSGGGGFKWYNATINTAVTPSTPPIMSLDQVGNITANSSTGYLNNATTPSPMRIMVGFSPLVAGTFTVNFAKPFGAGQVYVMLGIISSGTAGTAIPTVGVFNASNTTLTVVASSATATNIVYWVVYGNP